MNSEKIVSAMKYIDDELISEACVYPNKKNANKTISMLVVCALLCICVSVFLYGKIGSKNSFDKIIVSEHIDNNSQETSSSQLSSNNSMSESKEKLDKLSLSSDFIGLVKISDKYEIIADKDKNSGLSSQYCLFETDVIDIIKGETEEVNLLIPQAESEIILSNEIWLVFAQKNVDENFFIASVSGYCYKYDDKTETVTSIKNEYGSYDMLNLNCVKYSNLKKAVIEYLE